MNNKALQIKTHEAFLIQLSKIDWNKYEDRSFTSADGWKFHWYFDMHTHERHYPIQLVVRLGKNGNHVMLWGCEDREDTLAFVKWIEAMKHQIYTKYKSLDVSDTLKMEFWNL